MLLLFFNDLYSLSNSCIILAKSIGALLPLLAKKLKLDPAVCASPMITTIVDCAAILIYFAIASSVFANVLG